MLCPTLIPKCFQHRPNRTSHFSENTVHKTVKILWIIGAKSGFIVQADINQSQHLWAEMLSCVISVQQLHILDTFIFGSLNSTHA